MIKTVTLSNILHFIWKHIKIGIITGQYVENEVHYQCS